MKVDRKELENIYNLVSSEDAECRALGVALYQQSSFRKYVRNKRFICKDTPTISFKFPLNTPRNTLVCIEDISWRLEVNIRDFLAKVLIIIKRNKKWKRQKNYKKS